MFSHSWITAVWMLFALALHQLVGLSPFVMAIAITFIWYGREQYTEELRYRARGDGGAMAKLPTLVPFLWSKWNGDFIVPVAVAWGMASAFVLAGR